MNDLPEMIMVKGHNATALSNDERLADLANQINENHQQVITAYRAARDTALEIGRMLIEAKGLVQHGKWAPWIRANCKFSMRTAERYMQMAEEGTRADYPDYYSAGRGQFSNTLDLIATGEGEDTPDEDENDTVSHLPPR